MAYVNEVKQGSKVFEIRDKRIGEVTVDDNGKVLAVGVDGTLGFETPSNPVTANPTLEGGEANLNSIQIGEQKYKVAGFTINYGVDIYDEDILQSICADHIKHVVDTMSMSNYVLNGNPIYSSYSRVIYACQAMNYGLQVLGLTDRVNGLGEIVDVWNTYKTNQQLAFLLMDLILVSFNTGGIEIRDSQNNIIKFVVNVDQETPANSNFTQYVLTEDTSNGYELKYVGTHYTIADTATIMDWSFGNY